MNQQQIKQLRLQCEQLGLDLKAKNKQLRDKENSLALLGNRLQQAKSQENIQLQKLQALTVYVGELQRKIDLEAQKDDQEDPQFLQLQKSVLQRLITKKQEERKAFAQLRGVFGKIQAKEKLRTQSLLKLLQHNAAYIAQLRSQHQSRTEGASRCQRKWFKLSNQNQLLKERIAALNRQVQRQNVTFSTIYTEHLQRTKQAARKLVQLEMQGKTEKSKMAASQLVQQIARLQVGNQTAAEENQGLHVQMQQMLQQLQSLKLQQLRFQQFWQQQSEEARVLSRLRDKIEQLKDSICERQHTDQSPALQLSKLLQQLQGKCKEKTRAVAYLKRRQQNALVAGDSLIDNDFCQGFFRQLIQQMKQKQQLLATQNKTFQTRLHSTRSSIAQCNAKSAQLRKMLQPGLII